MKSLFLIITIIITSISKAQQQQLLGSNSSNQTVSHAKQQQQPFVSKGISFDIDNVTFSHHMASVNGIQIHYVIGGQGDPGGCNRCIDHLFKFFGKSKVKTADSR